MVDQLLMKVTAINGLSSEINEYVLAANSGDELPPAEAGAHIGVQTPAGAMRQYSLVHPDVKPATYTIAVKRDTHGRGGSVAMHTVEVGSTLEVLPPVNQFCLTEAPGYLLIAGGIGITPIYAMAQQLVAQGAEVQVIYCARSAAEAAYLTDLQNLLGDRLIAHFDNGDPADVYDFWDHFEQPGKQHVFCCGPATLMEEIKGISGHWPDNSIHFEDFAGVTAVLANDKPFEVTLNKSATTITVPANQSILEALRDAGIESASSCESGTCGTCKCGLISGDVEHRDMVLMDEERSSYIMICVSRAGSGGLVLDL